LEAKPVIVQAVVPVEPGDGLLQLNVGPESCWKDTNVVFAGTAFAKVIFAELSGP
jgi:hypothetical protein